MTLPLDSTRIEAALPARVHERVRVEVVDTIDSTNAELLRRGPLPGKRSVALLAEHQTAGRGRRGRAWLAPDGQSLCLSLGRTFARLPDDPASLGLCIGVATLRAIEALGFGGAMLKWPNDVVVGPGKLAGVLVELRTDNVGPAYVVVGIGMNVSLDGAARARIVETGAEPADFRALRALARDAAFDSRNSRVNAGTAPPSGPAREAIAAQLIEHCILALDEFEREGLRPFLAEWLAADALRAVPVTVSGTDEPVHGLARGIDSHGALLVETSSALRRFVSGEVTVRRSA